MAATTSIDPFLTEAAAASNDVLLLISWKWDFYLISELNQLLLLIISFLELENQH